MEASPVDHNVGIIMNGVTGRMGTNQHLIRSICAIRQQGGIKLADGEVIMPDPILVGRNPLKLRELCVAHEVARSTTDLDAALDDPRNIIYFDAQTTGRRADAVKKAIAKGKHVYCEKPIAVSSAEAYELYQLAKAAGVKNGVVQDKLWLPRLVKPKTLLDSGFFGQVLSVRGEFGYWVFDGKGPVLPQRPSWNYRKEDDGGFISDMLCHWQYVLQDLFGEVRSLTCKGATHIPERVDEQGKVYKCTADDAAYATFELDGGIVELRHMVYGSARPRKLLYRLRRPRKRDPNASECSPRLLQHRKTSELPCAIVQLVQFWRGCDTSKAIQYE